jgi:hypothetical protein
MRCDQETSQSFDVFAIGSTKSASAWLSNIRMGACAAPASRLLARAIVRVDARSGFVRREIAIRNGKSHSVFLLVHNRIFFRCFKDFFNVPLK